MLQIDIYLESTRGFDSDQFIIIHKIFIKYILRTNPFLMEILVVSIRSFDLSSMTSANKFCSTCSNQLSFCEVAYRESDLCLGNLRQKPEPGEVAACPAHFVHIHNVLSPLTVWKCIAAKIIN